MKSAKLLFAALTLTLCAASTAFAGTKIMATAPASHFYPSVQTLECNLLNANKSDKLVTIDVMDYYGFVLDTSGQILLPSYTGATVTNVSGGSWCRFTVDGSAKKYRGVAAYNDGTRYTTINPAQ